MLEPESDLISASLNTQTLAYKSTIHSLYIEHYVHTIDNAFMGLNRKLHSAFNDFET